MLKNTAKLYISASEIEKMCIRLGQEISSAYTGSPLVLITVLKGSILFFADFVRHLTNPFEADFVRLSSYGSGTETSGVIKILQPPSLNLKNKDILIIEDIVDTGLTLTFFKDYLKSHDVRSVKICALLDKPSRRKVKLDTDFCGSKIDDHFVVGYGLDFNEICRNYPDIYQIVE